MALTRRQKDVLDYIAKFLQENGYSPSYEEIGGGLQLASLATVHKHIAALEAKQYLRRGFNQSRSVEISPKYFEEMRTFLREKRISPSYLPERLEALDEMPMTPSGKIQKFVLRERAAALV